MMNIFINIHKYWAYVALLLLLVAVIRAFMGKAAGRPFTVSDRKTALFALIACHIQLLFGLIVYGSSPLGYKALELMKDAQFRLTALEHPLINVLAIVAITIGWSKHKKADNDGAKFGKISVFYAIGLVLILSRIPWKLWLA